MAGARHMVGSMLAVVIAIADVAKAVVAVASALMAVMVFVKLLERAVMNAPEAVPLVSSAKEACRRSTAGCSAGRRIPHAVRTCSSNHAH